MPLTLTPEKIADLRLKQLEMNQAIITRVAGYNANLKNYCITLTTAICGFAISMHDPNAVFLALLPVITFMLLDAQYLRVERRFRMLYDRIRLEDWSAFPTFDLNIKNAPSISFFPVLFSWSILFFYGALAVGVVVVHIAARYNITGLLFA